MEKIKRIYENVIVEKEYKLKVYLKKAQQYFND